MIFREYGDLREEPSGKRFSLEIEKIEKKGVSHLCKFGNTAWKWSEVFERKKTGIIKKNWKSYDESHMCSEVDELKEQ